MLLQLFPYMLCQQVKDDLCEILLTHRLSAVFSSSAHAVRVNRNKPLLFYFNIMKCASPMVLLEFQCPTTQVCTPLFSLHLFFSSDTILIVSQLCVAPPFPVYIGRMLVMHSVSFSQNSDCFEFILCDFAVST